MGNFHSAPAVTALTVTAPAVIAPVVTALTVTAPAVGSYQEILEDNEWTQTQTARLAQLLASSSPDDGPPMNMLVAAARAVATGAVAAGAVATGAVLERDRYQQAYHTILSGYLPEERGKISQALGTMFNLTAIEQGKFDRISIAMENPIINSILSGSGGMGLVTWLTNAINESKQTAELVTGHYVSFAIGSAGGHILGIPKENEHDNSTKGWLSTGEDVKDFVDHSIKYNISGGYIDVAGIGGTVSIMKTTIKEALKLAAKQAACLVLYFTGHGYEGSGDWAFVDGRISFEGIFELITIAKVKTYLVSDCCFSGCWVEKAKKKQSPFCEVIAASGKDEKALNRRFAKAFWRGEDVDKALETSPCKSVEWKTSKHELMSRDDLNRRWFVNRKKYDVDWMENDPNWRPKK